MEKKVVLTSEDLKDGEYFDGVLSYEIDREDRTAQVSIAEEIVKIVEIPSNISIDGTSYTISYIGEPKSYYYYNYIEEIILPPTLVSIGKMAFYECESLKRITIPEGVYSIGESAFEGCCSLTSVIIPKSTKVIGDFAFQGCVRLSDIQLKGDDTKIGKNVFEATRWYWEKCVLNCSEPMNESINPDAVLNCQNLDVAYNQKVFAYLNPQTKGEYILPDGIETILNGAFSWCKELSNVILPSSVNRIEDRAFYGCGIRSIVLPDGTNSIGKEGFASCFNLESIVLPNTIKYIRERTFKGCRNLSSVTIPNGITKIEDSMFSGCENLVSVDIPNGVKSIGHAAFRNCDKLESIIIPENVKHIDSNAFSGCNHLVSVVIPDGVETIGSGVFENCESLQNIIIPKSVKSIGSNVFKGCNSLKAINQKELINIPSYYDVLELLDQFYYYEGIWYELNFKEHIATVYDWERRNEFTERLNWSESVDLVIPNTIDAFNTCFAVMCIGSSAFQNFYSLHSVTLPNHIKQIGGYAFEMCHNLEQINIPDSIESIGLKAFYYCEKLRNIELPVSCERMINICGGLRNYIVTMSVIASGTDGYERQDGALVNKIFNGSSSFVIPDGYKAIEPKAFYRCAWINEVIISNGVTEIGEQAFYDCCISSVTIPNSVNIIRSCAFEGCDRLSSVTIPDSVTTIGSYAFGNCSSLSSVTIPNSVTSIGDGAFSGCDNLTSIIIPSSVRKIGKRAFPTTLKCICVSEDNPVYDSRNDCNAIIETSTNALIIGCEKTVIPDNVMSIEECAFDGCKLNTIKIPHSITTIKESAFANCRITSIYIPSCVINIETGAFYGSQLEKIEIDANNPVYDSRNKCNAIIETSTNKLHTGCSNTIIPNDIKVIGPFAFADCVFKTEELLLPDNLEIIDDFAFYNYQKRLTNLVVPSEVKYIGFKAFVGVVIENVYSRIIHPDQCYTLSNAFDKRQQRGGRDPECGVDYDFTSSLFVPEGSLYLYKESSLNTFDCIIEFDFEKWQVIPFKVIKSENDFRPKRMRKGPNRPKD